MKNDWETKIDQKYKVVTTFQRGKVKSKDLLAAGEWFQEIPAEIRQKEIYKIAYIWLTLLKNFDESKEKQKDYEFGSSIAKITELIADNEISNKFQVDQETTELVEDVYGIPIEQDKVWCVIRCNNLPYKNVFPDEVCNPKYLAGLFRRHEEVQ